MLRFVRLARPTRRCFSSGSQPSVGFIGLGNMGGHMANNLVKAGRRVVVFDVNQEAIDAAKSNGAEAAPTPKALAEQVDVVVTMLPSSPHVKEVYCGADGILAGVRPGALLIDSSTIDPETAQTVAAEAMKSEGVHMVDAPVSGGVGGAEQGTLTFMVGGPEEAFSRSKPVLEQMGANIVHCGDAGTGQVAKICNNLVLAISMVGVSEAMNLGVKLGMEPGKLAGIMNTSTARCWSSDTYNPCPGVMEGVPSSRGYTGGFGVDLMKKDLGLALMAGETGKAVLPMGEKVHGIYEDISKAGNGKKDFSFAYEHFKNQ